ncbi:MAG: DUF881 domain-containing protein [Micropruina sp.]|nr:DUF881 domain-containing protein [Micropruina sp.]
MAKGWQRAVVALRRAARAPKLHSFQVRTVSFALCIFAGLMIATGYVNSRGTDLRPSRNTELVGLIRTESERNAELASRVAALRADVDSLAETDDPNPEAAERLNQAAAVAGQSPVQGPAVSVTLTDAPLNSNPAGVDGDLLVVHQQDIQAVVNALWSAGAEAMTIQGQRVTSRTGVKCVGNSIVLHGIPYAPPYVVVAIGDQSRLETALATSTYLEIYRQYVRAYGLGYSSARLDQVTLPAYRGSVEITAVRVG